MNVTAVTDIGGEPRPLKEPMTLLFSAAVALTSVAVIAMQRSPLMLFVNTAEYFSEEYAARPEPGAAFVFYVGEPIRLNIQVFNADEREHTVNSPSLTASDALTVAAAARDGEPTNVGLAIEPHVEKHEGGFVIPVDWRETRLDPRASLHWKAELPRDLRPGVYVVDFAIDAYDENAQHVAPYAPRFRFEVRQPSPDAALEITRRRGMRAFLAGDYDVAERETRALLRLHPNSLLAYITLGQIAEAQGHTVPARAAFQRALAIASSASDPLDRRRTNPEQNAELIRFLESRLMQ
jgi:hypothetical protein